MRCETTNQSERPGGLPLEANPKKDFWLHVCSKCGYSDIYFYDGPPEFCPTCQEQEWYLYLNPKDNEVLHTPDGVELTVKYGGNDGA